MHTTVKIIRAIWANTGSENVFSQIPKIPTIKNQVVYVWGEDVNSYIQSLGYETRLVEDNMFSEEDNTEYGRKLIALDFALKEFGEVLLLDWDCYILRPFDDKFYSHLSQKPIQCPLYSQHKNTSSAFYEAFPDKLNDSTFSKFAKVMEEHFSKYNWKLGDGLVTPNFGCVYSRYKTFGEELIQIAIDNNIQGCVEEHAMWIYSQCSLDEYIDKFQPVFVQGVSDDRTTHNLKICKVQRELNSYVSERTSMDLYLKHI